MIFYALVLLFLTHPSVPSAKPIRVLLKPFFFFFACCFSGVLSLRSSCQTRSINQIIQTGDMNSVQWSHQTYVESRSRLGFRLGRCGGSWQFNCKVPVSL